MGRADYFKPGSWNLRCSECDKKIKADEARKRWDGFWVCWRCWEIRNPQDFVRGIPDNMSVPYSTSDPPPVFFQSGPLKNRVVGAMLMDSLTIG